MRRRSWRSRRLSRARTQAPLICKWIWAVGRGSEAGLWCVVAGQGSCVGWGGGAKEWVWRGGREKGAGGRGKGANLEVGRGEWTGVWDGGWDGVTDNCVQT